MQLVVWLLLVFGLTYLISASAIFRVPRRFLKALSGFTRDLLSCAPCTSFWVGLCLGLEGSHAFVGDFGTFSNLFIDHFFGGVVSIGLVSLTQFIASVQIAEEDDANASEQSDH